MIYDKTKTKQKNKIKTNKTPACPPSMVELKRFKSAPIARLICPPLVALFVLKFELYMFAVHALSKFSAPPTKKIKRG
jgi:hypothetical protein